MAKGTNLVIPQALLSEQENIITYKKINSIQLNVASTNKSVFSGKSVRLETLFRRESARCGEWLANRHLPLGTVEEKRDFALLRRNEIESGFFDPQFFLFVPKVSDNAEISTPTCTPFTGSPLDNGGIPPVNKNYCIYRRPSSRYTLPPISSGLPQPSPGWGGGANNGTWDNEYHVQQLSIFAGLSSMFLVPGQIQFVVVDATIEFNSSDQGIKFWPSICCGIGNGEPPSITSFTYPDTFIKPISRTKFRLAKKQNASPFNWVVQQKVIFAIKEIEHKYFASYPFRQHVWVGLTPPSGRYFGKNNNASASCVFNISIPYSI